MLRCAPQQPVLSSQTFTRHAYPLDAQVVEHTGAKIEAQVIGVSLSDIIKAYSNPAAVAARESFVLIPTMAEVGAARHLLKARGAPEPGPNQLSPANGLVPIFWSELLAVQTAGGKQRKVGNCRWRWR